MLYDVWNYHLHVITLTVSDFQGTHFIIKYTSLMYVYVRERAGMEA